MLAQLRDAVIASVRRRAEQGDCPTEPAHSIETLENVILDLVAPSCAPGEVLPCPNPWCDSDSPPFMHRIVSHRDEWAMSCGCGFLGPVLDSADRAEAAWNSRRCAPGEVEELATTLDVYLAAYKDAPDEYQVTEDDDLLTFGVLRRILAALSPQGLDAWVKNAADVKDGASCYRTIGGVRWGWYAEPVAIFKAAGVRHRAALGGGAFVHPDDDSAACTAAHGFYATPRQQGNKQ